MYVGSYNTIHYLNEDQKMHLHEMIGRLQENRIPDDWGDLPTRVANHLIPALRLLLESTHDAELEHVAHFLDRNGADIVELIFLTESLVIDIKGAGTVISHLLTEIERLEMSGGNPPTDLLVNAHRGDPIFHWKIYPRLSEPIRDHNAEQLKQLHMQLISSMSL